MSSNVFLDVILYKNADFFLTFKTRYLAKDLLQLKITCTENTGVIGTLESNLFCLY